MLWQALKGDVGAMRAAGADGVVIGMLTPARRVDVSRMRELMAEAGPLSITFHRAFDDVADPLAALEDLMELEGVDRVLTSGLARSAWEGRDLIKRLIERSLGKLTILPGGWARGGGSAVCRLGLGGARLPVL
jgi:copper homeostasis protein